MLIVLANSQTRTIYVGCSTGASQESMNRLS